jgi:2'-5' RNA ligase
VSDPSVRLFFGLGVPRHLLDALQAAVAPIREEVRGARWIDPENQHITIKFLGRTPEELVGQVVDAARGVSAELAAWTTALTHLGAFPNPRRARVLWAGLDDEDGEMAALAQSVDRATDPLGFESETRAFTPHLTLARIKVPGPLPDLPEVEEAVRERFPIDELRLYRSHLSPRGARYEILERIPFGGANGS